MLLEIANFNIDTTQADIDFILLAQLADKPS